MAGGDAALLVLVGQTVQVELAVDLAEQATTGSPSGPSRTTCTLHGPGVEQVAVVGGDRVSPLRPLRAAARLTAVSTWSTSAASSRASTWPLRVARPPRLASRPATNSSATVATCSAESIPERPVGVVKNQL